MKDLEQLVAAIRAVADGGSMIDPNVVEALVAENARGEESPLNQLTNRERDVLREMAEGKNNAAIAEALFLTERSVEKVIHSIFLKLGLTWEEMVHKRVKAVILYLAEEAPGVITRGASRGRGDPAGLDRIASCPPSASAVAQPVEFGVGGGPGRVERAVLVLDDLDDLEAERMLIFSHRDRHRSPADMLECLETAEVNPLPRPQAGSSHPRGRRRRHGCPRPRRTAAAARPRVEQRRVDPLRELRRLVERLLHVARHLFEQLLRHSRPRPCMSVRCRLTASATSC